MSATGESRVEIEGTASVAEGVFTAMLVAAGDRARGRSRFILFRIEFIFGMAVGKAAIGVTVGSGIGFADVLQSSYRGGSAADLRVPFGCLLRDLT